MKYNAISLLSFRQQIYHYYQKLFSTFLKTFGLTQAEMDVLLFLSNFPHRDTATEVATLRGLTKSHVSVAVESLVAKGYLAREQDLVNRKRIHLKVTPNAQSIVEEGQRLQVQFSNTLLEGFSDEEYECLVSSFRRILENLLAADGELEGLSLPEDDIED